MLSLALFLNQKITIEPRKISLDLKNVELFANDAIEIKINEIKGNQVELSLNYPPNFHVFCDSIRVAAKTDIVEKLTIQSFFKKYWSIWKNEVIFICSVFLASVLILSTSVTNYYGLGLSLFVLVSAALYYSATFFTATNVVEKLYYFVATMPLILLYFALMYRAFGIIPPRVQ